MKEKLLITGGSGLLGSNIAKMATSIFDVYAIYNRNEVSMKNIHFFNLDLTEKEGLSKIDQIGPNFVIHCAALANIDCCEQYHDQAYNQNVGASINIVEVVKKMGAYLIYISTDSVFDGVKGNYKEEDIPNPINIYGKMKLEAEKKVLSIYPRACLVRTNIYGWNKLDKLSLAEWMIDKLVNKEELPGVRDVYFSPILVNDLAEVLFKLYERKFEGIIHVAGSQSCSKLEFAYKIAKIFGFGNSLIRPVSIDDLKLKALRGKNMSLNVEKAENILQKKLPSIDEGLVRMKRLYQEGYVKELKHDYA